MGAVTLAPRMGADRPPPMLSRGALRRAWQAASVLGLGAFALHATLGLGGHGADHFFNRWLYSTLLVLAAGGVLARGILVRHERLAWLCLAGGVMSWAFADIYYTFAFAGDPTPPFPSVADGFYLAFYPAVYVALVLLVRERVREFPKAVWLDGLIAMLAFASLGATVLVETVLRATDGSLAVVATNMAYPIGDTLLLALTLGVFALAGWRPGRNWAFIGAGLIASAVADGIYLFQIAEGTYREGTYLDILWPASMLLIAQSAWHRPGRRNAVQFEGVRQIVAPSLFSLVPIGVLLYSHFEQLNLFAVVTAALTLVGVVGRGIVAFVENQDMLGRISRLAVTDALTGLGNRRKLLVDLEDALDAETPRERVLGMFDLDGFKTYNDRFGHPAGDVLLSRLAAKLTHATEGRASVYRLGGDEFCVLTHPGEPSPDDVLKYASVALSERGEGFAVGATYGKVRLPDEASQPAQVLAVADQRLYERKRSRSAEPGNSIEVLRQALHERRPELHERARMVADLAAAVGPRLGLVGAELDQVRHAAELQDIGMIAVPDDVLHKVDSLDEVDEDFIRGHAEVGERIINAATALSRLAGIVRSTHERWDGRGYPDGLSGESIPLAARIVAACDALVALTSDRPYRRALRADDALAELRRTAGTRFDPKVVDALEELSGLDLAA
jgi:two-component system, cell cycle response regulator